MAAEAKFEVGDVIRMKKPHPCGSSEWEILRVGADFRLKCQGCGHQVLQHILLVIIGLLIFVSQTGSIVHAPYVQIILQESGIDRLTDVVEGRLTRRPGYISRAISSVSVICAT